MDYITRNGKTYHSLKTARVEYPEITKYCGQFSVQSVVSALGLSTFTQNGELWIERIDKISNFYINFNHGYVYDDFRVPTPEGWVRFKEQCPEGTGMEDWLNLVTEFGEVKLDVESGHIASQAAVDKALAKAQEIAESIKQKPA